MIYEPFGWQGAKPTHRNQLPLPKAAPVELGNMDPGRIKDFVQGVQEAREERVKKLLEEGLVYFGLRAWSAWRRP